MPNNEPDLTPEQALARATETVATGPFAQLGITVSDPDSVGLRIAANLADAGSIDDLLAEGDTNGWEKHEGRSFLVQHVDFAPSTKPGALGIYAIATVRDTDTGEQLVLTSGATNVVIQLAKLIDKGWNDVPVALVIKQSAGGNEVHRLVKGKAGEATPF